MLWPAAGCMPFSESSEPQSDIEISADARNKATNLQDKWIIVVLNECLLCLDQCVIVREVVHVYFRESVSFFSNLPDDLEELC